MATAPTSIAPEILDESVSGQAAGSGRYSYAIGEGRFGKTKFISHLRHMAGQGRLVIGALPQSLVDAEVQKCIKKWCHQFNFAAMAEELTSSQPSDGRIFLLKKKSLRKPLPSPMRDLSAQPNLLYLHGAQSALEADCECREDLFDTLCAQLSKSNGRQIIVLLDIDGYHPKFTELVGNCKTATVYQYHSSMDGIRFDEECTNEDDGEAEVAGEYAGAAHPMVEHATTADEPEDFGSFANAEEVDAYEAKIVELEHRVRDIATGVISRHASLPQSAMRSKLAEPGYRQRRLGNFVTNAQETVHLKGIGKHQVAAVAALVFRETWDVLEQSADKGFDQDLAYRLKMVREKVPPLPPKPIGSFDAEAKEKFDDECAFLIDTYGPWLHKCYGTMSFKTLQKLDPEFAKAVSKCISRNKKSRRDFFPEPWRALENLELQSQGFLSAETIEKKRKREYYERES